MRRAHILKHNKGTEVPAQAIWVDTETDQVPIDEHGVEHRLRFGMAAYARRLKGGVWSAPDWLRFTSPLEFWGWVVDHIRPRTRCDIYCHNTSFDLPVLHTFSALPSLGWTLTRAIIDAPPTILTYRDSTRTIRILDTLNIWRMSLKELGNSIGTVKLPMPSPDAPSGVWDTYARQDVQVLIDACLSWWSVLVRDDLGGFAPTLAGQSMRIFRHKYMEHAVYLDDDEDALALSRSAYTGGRVECFRIGEITEPVYLYDINSMYPYVMHVYDMPTKLIGYSHYPRHVNLARQLATRAVVADVTVTTDEPVYPVRHEGRLVFPVGTFRSYLTTPELTYALEHDHLTALHHVATYEPHPLFRAFVSDMYARRLAFREAGNAPEAWRYKILMNSLYGKFGQRGMVWESEGETPDWTAKVWTEVRYEIGHVQHFRQFGGLVQRRRDEPESRDSHPAIAAHVTAYARCYLWSIIQHAGRENVYYCDTDSVLVNRAGAHRLRDLCHPTALGKLKCEGEYPGATLWGAKDYRIGTLEKHKGVRSTATWLTGDTIEQEKWSSLRGLLRQGMLTAPTTTRVTKVLRRIYSKGTVTASGAVSPLVFDDRSGL